MVKFITRTICMALVTAFCVVSLNAQGLSLTLDKEISASLDRDGWLTWSKGATAAVVGTGGNPVVFGVFHRYDVSDIAGYAGLTITKIKYNPYNHSQYPTTFTANPRLQIYTGGSFSGGTFNPGTLEVDYQVPNYTFNSDQTVDLPSEFVIPAGKEVWIGVCFSASEGYPACSVSPNAPGSPSYVEGKSNVFFLGEPYNEWGTTLDFFNPPNNLYCWTHAAWVVGEPIIPCDPATGLAITYSPDCSEAVLTWNEPSKGRNELVSNPTFIPGEARTVSNSPSFTSPISKEVPQSVLTPRGMVKVTLEANDVWGDGSGYHLLLDETATAHGSATGFPATGNPWKTCPLPADLYDWATHKIPTNATAQCSNTTFLVNGTATIYIPAGTYDFCFTNGEFPTQLWFPSTSDFNPRQNNFVFQEGKAYHFLAYISGQNDAIKMTVKDDVPIFYNIYRDDVLIKEKHNEATYTDKDFNGEVEHTWRVNVVCDDGGLSNPISLKKEACIKPCPSVKGTKAEIKDCQIATVTWTAAAGAKEYKVVRDGVEKIVTASPYTEESEFENGVTYTWTITTVCTTGKESEGVIAETKAICVGINELANNVSIYPNPVSGMVTIDVDNFLKVEIYNTVGQLIETQTVQKFDVSTYSTGVYFFKVFDANNNSVTKRVMVAK